LHLLDAAIPGKNLEAPLLQLGEQAFDNENEVALGEAYRHGSDDGRKDAQANGVGKSLLATLLLLLGLDALASGWPLLLRAVYGAFGVGADFAVLALLGAFGDDSLGHEFAVWYSGQSLCFFVLGSCGLISMYLLRVRAALALSVGVVAGTNADEICTSFGLAVMACATNPSSLDW
jgi:hypothetical protein